MEQAKCQKKLLPVIVCTVCDQRFKTQQKLDGHICPFKAIDGVEYTTYVLDGEEDDGDFAQYMEGKSSLMTHALSFQSKRALAGVYPPLYAPPAVRFRRSILGKLRAFGTLNSTKFFQRALKRKVLQVKQNKTRG